MMWQSVGWSHDNVWVCVLHETHSFQTHTAATVLPDMMVMMMVMMQTVTCNDDEEANSALMSLVYVQLGAR